MRMLQVVCAAGLAGTACLAWADHPNSLIAVLDATQNFGTTRRSVVFYDPAVSMDNPIFSVFTGFELPGNFEDPGAIAVNPYNGDMYVAAFDSGPVGVPDPVGDTQGDYDLYKIDFGKVYDHWKANGETYRMYSSGTSFDANVPVAARTTLAGSISKIGEVARNQSDEFYDFDLEFVDHKQLLLLDNQTGLDASGDTVPNDHVIRSIRQTSTSPGTGNSTQTWSSVSFGALDMDNGTGRSEPVDIAFRKQDGVEGVWVLESDGGGDDVRFFQITDYAAGSGSYRSFTTGSNTFALDEDPTVDPISNDGDGDFIIVKPDGTLLIGEGGFNDLTPHEPKVITRAVNTYDDSGSIEFGEWGIVGPLAVSGGDDDDAEVTNGLFVTYDKAENKIYYIDADSGSPPGVTSDVYTLDLDTGVTTRVVLNGPDHFTERHGVRWFLRGDITDDGRITGTDIDLLFDAVGQDSPFDLTSDAAISKADVDKLVEEIIGTKYGDTDLDHDVDLSDLSNLAAGYGQPGANWSRGDFDGDGDVDLNDLSTLAANYGTGQAEAFAAFAQITGTSVPEPASVGLVALAGLAMRRRRNR